MDSRIEVVSTLRLPQVWEAFKGHHILEWVDQVDLGRRLRVWEGKADMDLPHLKDLEEAEEMPTELGLGEVDLIDMDLQDHKL